MTRQPLAPAHDRVMVRPATAASMSTGGEHEDPELEGKDAVALHIPDEARDTPDTGEVLGVGPDVTSCRVGDVVMYGKYTGDKHPVEGEDVLFIRDPDVIGVEKGEAWDNQADLELAKAMKVGSL